MSEDLHETSWRHIQKPWWHIPKPYYHLVYVDQRGDLELWRIDFWCPCAKWDDRRKEFVATEFSHPFDLFWKLDLEYVGEL